MQTEIDGSRPMASRLAALKAKREAFMATKQLQRLGASIRRQGMAATFVKLWGFVSEHVYDLRNGTDTCRCSALESLTIAGENKTRGTHYEPTRMLPLRKLFRLIEPLLPDNRVLLDLGCGKGRVLLVSSEFRFDSVRGVEFAQELCEIARRNWAVFRRANGPKPACEVIEADVTLYPLRHDETVFFMGNPFDDVILQKVLDNIVASVRSHPRKVLIIYSNPMFAQAIDQRNEFKLLRTHEIWSYNVRVYSNRE
jgi:SAM-dependent methyltransferase